MSAYIKNGRVDTGNTGAQLAVRSGPGATFAQTGSIAHGTPVQVLSASGSWTKILQQNNSSSAAHPSSGDRWVSAAYIQSGRVNIGNSTAKLAVRSGPGQNYSQVGALQNGEAVRVLLQQNGWLKIAAPSQPSAVAQTSSAALPAGGGWVVADYVKNGRVDTGNTGAQLAVRSGPGKNYPQTGSLNHGLNLRVMERRDNWLLVGPSSPLPDPRPAPQPVKRRQQVNLPPVNNLVLNGTFASTSLTLPLPGGNSTSMLSGHWLRSEAPCWDIVRNGGNPDAYARAPKGTSPARLLYLAGDERRSTGAYTLQFDYIQTSPADKLEVKVFVSDRDISVGTSGGDFRMNDRQSMSDTIRLPESRSWVTYRLPVNLANGYRHIYVFFSGTGQGHTGIDNVTLSPAR